MLTRIDKPALMKRLFELGCNYSGQILSYTKMLGQLQDAGNTTTLAHYLHLLDTAGLLAGIEKYSPGIIRQRSSSPKFQVHNTALLTGQQTPLFKDIHSNPAIWGRWVESAVGAHLLNAAHTSGYKLFYWRDGNQEVDFILEYQGKVIGLEVKAGATRSLSGITVFQKKFNPYKIYLIGDAGIPWQDFLLMDVAQVF